MRYANYLEELIKAIDGKTPISYAEAERLLAENPSPTVEEFMAKVDEEIARSKVPEKESI